jgi:hypothetical protein
LLRHLYTLLELVFWQQISFFFFLHLLPNLTQPRDGIAEGRPLGRPLGRPEGFKLGTPEGVPLGGPDGIPEGRSLGNREGVPLGKLDGPLVGRLTKSYVCTKPFPGLPTATRLPATATPILVPASSPIAPNIEFPLSS